MRKLLVRDHYPDLLAPLSDTAVVQDLLEDWADNDEVSSVLFNNVKAIVTDKISPHLWASLFQISEFSKTSNVCFRLIAGDWYLVDKGDSPEFPEFNLRA